MAKGSSLDHIYLLKSFSLEELTQQWLFWKENYEKLIKMADPRVSNWPLMHSPFWTCFVVACYLFICYNSHRLKCNYDFKTLLIGYNSLCIFLNAYIVHQLWEGVTTYNWLCQPVDYNPKSKYSMQSMTCLTVDSHYEVWKK